MGKAGKGDFTVETFPDRNAARRESGREESVWAYRKFTRVQIAQNAAI